MSGRLTPVAATLIRMSPSLGCGTGRDVGTTAATTDYLEQVLPAAHELAARLAAGPTVAYGAIKRELLVGAAGTLADALAAEAQAQAICGATSDHQAAVNAFVAKQKPVFDGR